MTGVCHGRASPALVRQRRGRREETAERVPLLPLALHEQRRRCHCRSKRSGLLCSGVAAAPLAVASAAPRLARAAEGACRGAVLARPAAAGEAARGRSRRLGRAARRGSEEQQKRCDGGARAGHDVAEDSTATRRRCRAARDWVRTRGCTALSPSCRLRCVPRRRSGRCSRRGFMRAFRSARAGVARVARENSGEGRERREEHARGGRGNGERRRRRGGPRRGGTCCVRCGAAENVCAAFLGRGRRRGAGSRSGHVPMQRAVAWL